MTQITPKDISRHQILQYMAALYAENPTHENMQVFLSDPKNYTKYIAASCYPDRVSSRHLNENPNYYLSDDVASLFSSLRAMPKKEFSKLIKKYEDIALSQNLLRTQASLLHALEVEAAPQDFYQNIEKDGKRFSRNSDNRKIDDFHQWNHLPVSIMRTVGYGNSSSDIDRLQETVQKEGVVISSVKEQHLFFDTQKHPDGTMMAPIYDTEMKTWLPDAPQNQRASADWKRENDRLYINLGTDGKEPNWLEMRLNENKKEGTILFPNGGEMRFVLNAPLIEGGKVDATVPRDRLIHVAPYTRPELFNDMMDVKQRLDVRLGQLDVDLQQFAAQNKAAILGDKQQQDILRNKGYQERIEKFGDKFKNYVLPAELEEDYGPLFENHKELRPLFDQLYKSYQLLNKDVAPIQNPAEQKRVLDELLKRYFDPSSPKDYLFKDADQPTRDKLDRVFDILKNYQSDPKLKDRSFDEMLHQIDYELKDRFLKDEHKYRRPLNGSMCPSCDSDFKELIDSILKEKGLIVSNTKLPAAEVEEAALTNIANAAGRQTVSGRQVG